MNQYDASFRRPTTDDYIRYAEAMGFFPQVPLGAPKRRRSNTGAVIKSGALAGAAAIGKILWNKFKRGREGAPPTPSSKRRRRMTSRRHRGYIARYRKGSRRGRRHYKNGGKSKGHAPKIGTSHPTPRRGPRARAPRRVPRHRRVVRPRRGGGRHAAGSAWARSVYQWLKSQRTHGYPIEL